MTAPDYPVQSATDTGLDDRVRRDTDKVSETARRDLHDVADEVKKQGTALGEEARHQVENAAESARNMAAEQKDLLVGQMDGVTNALGKAANELEQEGQSGAQFARMIADSAERLTSTLRENDLDSMLGKAQDFGRRQPVAFMGAAALLGFAASRFVGASASRASARSTSATRPSVPATPAAPSPAGSSTIGSGSAVDSTSRTPQVGGGNDAGY